MDAGMRPTAIDYAGLPVTVMGLGLFGGGSTVARHLARRGARVTVTDQRSASELAAALSQLDGLGLRFVLGEHRTEDFTRAGLVVANPAVAPHSPYLRAARAAGVPITSETALFLEACPARIAAVTGTQGKSSTCHTLHQLLSSAGLAAHLGGNIGHSLLEEAETMRPEEIVVLEISSYQLEVLPPTLGTPGSPPAVEAVCAVNVLADHLERHGSLAAYAAAKRRILELVRASGGTAILPAEDPWIGTWRDADVRRIEAWFHAPASAGCTSRPARSDWTRSSWVASRTCACPGCSSARTRCSPWGWPRSWALPRSGSRRRCPSCAGCRTVWKTWACSRAIG
jgi:UDP-N-acetylmuramoylalanine--D-glutamate ligase